MGAGTCVYVAVVLGYVITSARSFLVQIPLLATVAATSAARQLVAGAGHGPGGAALAVAIAASFRLPEKS